MFQDLLSILIADIQGVLGRVSLSTTILLLTNLAFNILANASFKYSAFSRDWHHFLAWQILGNLAGFITVITLTGLLRFIPLSVAFPVTTGLAVIGVQIASARFLFGESVSPAQWLGTLLIVAGIWFIGAK
jgi:multidrug transporter EmrE-like cation transporter